MSNCGNLSPTQWTKEQTFRKYKDRCYDDIVNFRSAFLVSAPLSVKWGWYRLLAVRKIWWDCICEKLLQNPKAFTQAENKVQRLNNLLRSQSWVNGTAPQRVWRATCSSCSQFYPQAQHTRTMAPEDRRTPGEITPRDPPVMKLKAVDRSPGGGAGL